MASTTCCSYCHEPIHSRCRRCGRPLCVTHAHGDSTRCRSCEVVYESIRSAVVHGRERLSWNRRASIAFALYLLCFALLLPVTCLAEARLQALGLLLAADLAVLLPPGCVTVWLLWFFFRGSEQRELRSHRLRFLRERGVS